MMNEEYEADLITLVDDEGNEHEFEIIDEIDFEDGHYMALMPTGDDPEKEISSDTYYIFEVVEEDGEEQLAEVEDDELWNRLADVFEQRYADSFEDGDESADEE